MEHLTPQKCPQCSAELNAATVIEDPDLSASPGDFTVCFYCGEILRFDAQLHHQKVTKQELKNLQETDLYTFVLLQKAQKKIKQREAELN